MFDRPRSGERALLVRIGLGGPPGEHELSEFEALARSAGAEVLVASVDAKYAQRAWADAEQVGLTLVSDFWPHGAVARAYGAFDDEAGYATRASFVIGADGVIRSSFATGPGEARSIAAYREALAALH